MRPTINIRLDGRRDLQRAFAIAPTIVREELLAAVTEAQMLLQREVQENTPVGASGGSGLRASIIAGEPTILADNVIGAVGSSLPHVIPVELGTAPHMPPILPLVMWAEKVLGVRGEEAEQVARRVAFKIKAKGTKGVGMFHRAYERNRSQVGRIFDKRTERIRDRIARGAH